MNHSEEKQMAGDYEITQSFRIGNYYVVFGVNETKPLPYLCAHYIKNELFGVYEDAVAGDNFAQMSQRFAERIAEQAKLVLAEQEQLGEYAELFDPAKCDPNDYKKSIEGKVICIKPSELRPEYRTTASQLYLATGGSGTHANCYGRAVYCTNLWTGEKSRWNREDVQGIVREDALPKWAVENKSIFEKQKQEKSQEQAR